MDRIETIKDPNVYQVAELYHQLLMRVGISLMPKVTTRRAVDINNNPDVMMDLVDPINNLILYDETKLYIYEEPKLCRAYKPYNDTCTKVVKLRDITVFYDEEICMFIVVPEVSKTVKRRIKKFSRGIKRSISVDYLTILAHEFCDQLRIIYAAIAQRYVRDMAVYSIKYIPNKDIKLVLIDNNNISDVSNIVCAIHTLYTFSVYHDFAKLMEQRRWRPEMMLFNRALMVHYYFIHKELNLPYVQGLIDPIINIYCENTEELQFAYSNDTITTSSEWLKVEFKDGSSEQLGVVRFNWAAYLHESDSKILTTQFNVNKIMSNTLPAQFVALNLYWQGCNIDSDRFKYSVDDIVKTITGEYKNRINDMTIMRINPYPVDDLPHIYESERYITIKPGNKNW